MTYVRWIQSYLDLVISFLLYWPSHTIFLKCVGTDDRLCTRQYWIFIHQKGTDGFILFSPAPLVRRLETIERLQFSQHTQYITGGYSSKAVGVNVNGLEWFCEPNIDVPFRIGAQKSQIYYSEWISLVFVDSLSFYKQWYRLTNAREHITLQALWSPNNEGMICTK